MGYTKVSPEKFAEAVAARIRRIIPHGYEVQANGYGVNFGHHGDWATSLIADIVAVDDGRPFARRLELAAERILDLAQDIVMESSAEQWPMDHQERRSADPAARLVGNRLLMWYGEEGKPILELDPIDLAEVA